MAGEIGTVRATFTASASGLTGAVSQSITALGSFAAAARRTEAQTTAYGTQTTRLAEQLAAGAVTADEYATRVGRIQGAFKGIGEYERMRVGLAGIAAAAKAGAISETEAAAAADKLAASVQAVTPPVERLSIGLAKNRAEFVAGAITAEQYRSVIATLPDEINGVETEQQRMARVFAESRETLRSLRTPTDEYRSAIARLDEQLQAGVIDEQQYAAAAKKAKEALDGKPEKIKSVGDALGGLPGPLGSAARLFDQFRTSLAGTAAQFKSGGIIGGLKGLASDIGGGLANAASTGGQSLVGVAPQVALVAGAALAGAVAVKQLASALGAVGSDVERTEQLANRLGVSFQEFEVLSAAAKSAGVPVDNLAGGMTKFLKTLDGAREGTKKAAAGFLELGFTQEQLKAGSANDIMQEAAKRIAAIEDPAKRAATAMAVFGKSGNSLLPALAAIDKTRDDLTRLGGTMRDVDKVRFSGLDDAFDRVGIATQRLGRTLLVPFTELFTKLADGLAYIAGGVSSAIAPWADLAATVLGASTGFDVFGQAINLALRASGAITQILINGVKEFAGWVAGSEALAGGFQLAYGAVDFLWKGLRGIGGIVEFVVKKLEQWAGITITPPDFKGVNEDNLAEKLDEQAAAAENSKSAAKQMESDAKRIAESLLTPMQKYQREVADARKLEKEGLLTLEQRLAYEQRLADELQKQDPARKAAAKAAEEQKAAAKELAAEFENARGKSAELGGAADGIRRAFAVAAAGVQQDFAGGVIDKDTAKAQMKSLVDDLDSELKRLGDDMKFADKIRDELKSAGDKMREEIKAIQENQTLNRDEKDEAIARVKERAAEKLPGGDALDAAMKDPVAKFQNQLAGLKDALADGVIDEDGFRDRVGRLRDELAREAENEEERREKAGRVNREPNKATVVNSSEGAAEFFRLLRGQEEPTAKQYREMMKQSKLLDGIKQVIGTEIVVELP
jgi:hypothetical protein